MEDISLDSPLKSKTATASVTYRQSDQSRTPPFQRLSKRRPRAARHLILTVNANDVVFRRAININEQHRINPRKDERNKIQRAGQKEDITTPTSYRHFKPDVSIPGLAVFYEESAGIFRKTVWGVAVALCFTICAMQIRRQVREYWNIPVSVDVKVIREEKPMLPAVTICPFYPFRYNKVLKERLRTLRSDVNASDTSLEFFDLLQLSDVNATSLWHFGRVGERDVERKILCKQFSTKTNCHLKILRKDLITYLGICTTYTLDAPVVYDGPYNGYHLHYYLHGNDGTSKHHYTLTLHHPDDDLTHLLYKDAGVFLESFVQTYIVYSRQEFRNVNIPRRPCLPRKEVANCYKNCVEKFVSENATCRLPYIPTSTLPLCSKPDEARNTYRATLNVYRTMDLLCKHCPRKCQYDFYRLSETSLQKLNYTRVTVYMMDNVVQVVTELTPYTLDKLLSDIGGMLGLFMGVCILTVLQLVEALFIQIKERLQAKCSSRYQ